MSSIPRRTFLAQGSLALIGSLSACAAPGIGSRAVGVRDAYARIGMTTVGLRSRFPKTRQMNGGPVTTPELTLLSVPEFIADEVGLHNVEIWDLQFEDLSIAYCQQIRAAAARVGSRIVNIQVEGVGDLSAESPAARAEAVLKSRQWMDRAVAVGAPSIRVNTGPTGGRPFDVRITAESFRQIADYGQQVGVTVLVENHGTPIPNVVAIVQAVNHPRCRSLVDFGNTTPSGSTEEKIASLQPMFPYLGFVSAKAEAFDEAYQHTSWDFGALIRAVENSGYQGMYSLELWNTRNPPADTPRAAREIRDLIAANLRS